MYIDFPELYFYMMNEFTSQPFSSLFVKNGRFKFEKFENFDKVKLRIFNLKIKLYDKNYYRTCFLLENLLS